MIALLLLLLAAPPQPTTDDIVHGIVTDQSGLPVNGATVIMGSGSARHETTTGVDGHFSIAAPPQADVHTIVVRAPGFAEGRSRITGSGPVVVVLKPAGVAETVTVAATRTSQVSGDVPASMTLVSSGDIHHAAAITTDDLLREVPSFSLFRRSSSLVSHPTTQGVSLRGIGPSGVSRTLVLVDGIPANDPFGGWVYWSRVPVEGADRIEVAEGPASNLYGNYAMGGVISIVTRPVSSSALSGRVQYGGENTSVGDVTAGAAWHRVGVLATAGGLHTGGYPIVAAGERGPIDTNASTASASATLKLDFDPQPGVHLFARGGYFHEHRNNGKVSSIDGTPEANTTWWRSVSAGTRLRSGAAGEVEVNAFGDSEDFRSNFLAVPATIPPRTIARATLNQDVPAHDAGFMARWTRSFGTDHVVTAGSDWRTVRGESREDALDAATGTQVTLHRISGGRQQTGGVYVQDMFAPTSSVVITAGARVDHWANDEGHNLETTVEGVPTANNNPTLANTNETVTSPRVAVLVRVHPRVQLWGGAAGGFRAPTLNELYRQFRVGSTLTLPNPNLDAEHLVGVEGGATIAPSNRATVRAMVFANRLTGPVSNVTLSSTASAITQQRQNLGRTRANGLELDGEYRVEPRWTVAASYIYTRATVAENPAVPDLVGNVLPQVPSHRGSVRATYSHPRLGSISTSMLFASSQFDDDRNTPSRKLPAYAVVDLQATRALHRSVEIFIAAQNLFNETYETGTLPTTVGLPRLVSAGVRVRVGGR